MPPKPPLANTAKIELHYQGPNAVKATNIFYCQGATDISGESTLAAITTNLHTAMTNSGSGDEWKYLFNNGWELTDIFAIDNSGETENFYDNNSFITGGATGVPYPPSVAWCISWDINARYRGGHPRTYMPGVDNSMTAVGGGNMLSSGFITTAEAVATYVLATFNGTPANGIQCALGTISYNTGNEPRPTPLWRPFLSGVVHGRLDSQRRRSGKEVTPTG